MYISEKSQKSIVERSKEYWSHFEHLSDSAKKVMARKPYHLDNGTNLIEKYNSVLMKKKGR